MYVYEVSPRWSHIGIPAGGNLRKLGTYPVPGAGLRPPSGNQAAARFCLAGEAQVDQRRGCGMLTVMEGVVNSSPF